MSDAQRRGLLGVVCTLGLIAAVVATLATGTPSKLPGVALGAPVLLHVERAAALFLAFTLLLLVITKSWAGELPTEITDKGLKYATQDLRDSTLEALQALKENAEQEREARARLEARIERLEAE